MGTLITKALAGACAVLLIACIGFWLYSNSLKSDLASSNKKLEAATAMVDEKERTVKANNKVIEELELANRELAKERSETNKKLADILAKPANKDWGEAAVPEDVARFLLEMGKGMK